MKASRSRRSSLFPHPASAWQLLQNFTTYGIFAALTTKAVKPTLDRGISGTWLLAVVATQAIAVLGVLLAPGLPATAQSLITDPQTSGGLLVSCAPEDVDAVLATFARDGFDRAAIIGEIVAGAPRIVVR